MNLLRTISAKIETFCNDEGNPIYDTIFENHENFEEHINRTVYYLAEIARVDFIERQFYTGSEVCNA